ncbi:MAG: type II toxin-antitoxin system VapC family toxin [Deinococcus sp.]|uniref:type II toxin-antitoxin system VapC family toxin n=1 Tax=Deinococcus sp. TaxID=47478 RepID=UPI0026DDA5CD|nr:type II toxin-antitoxin system VapC family toxin [Deinococcus sp.]MDO4245786.1 type II toxin-antitoxin system VapC family toxin [Deinococcus sp.]
MRLLLDTHILLWLTLKPELLPAALLPTLQSEESRFVVSAASIWEISIKHHLGKLPEAAPLMADVEDAVASLGADLLPMTHRHALRAGELDWAHRDPFDRMLVAQAQVEGLRLMTLDEHIRRFSGAPLLEGPA